MKGIVFTEFLDLVGQLFSENMVDDLIDDAQLPHGGAYTAVGTYPHQEIVALVLALSARTGAPVPELLRTFGHHLFGRFVSAYPAFFVGSGDAFQFLAGIEDIIHAEVRKLYPDAELPRFQVEHHDTQRLVLLYQSGRHFEDLAEGLIQGCLQHFADPAQIHRQVVGEGPARQERFELIRP